jgi:hypothetical protein
MFADSIVQKNLSVKCSSMRQDYQMLPDVRGYVPGRCIVLTANKVEGVCRGTEGKTMCCRTTAEQQQNNVQLFALASTKVTVYI